MGRKLYFNVQLLGSRRSRQRSMGQPCDIETCLDVNHEKAKSCTRSTRVNLDAGIETGLRCVVMDMNKGIINLFPPRLSADFLCFSRLLEEHISCHAALPPFNNSSISCPSMPVRTEAAMKISYFPHSRSAAWQLEDVRDTGSGKTSSNKC